jgi:hypothetical protein
MKARQVITRILLPGLALWAILWACNTPSIPMPPPGSEIVSFIQSDLEDHYIFVIDPNPLIQPGAEVTIKNRDENLWVGGIAEPDGSFESQPFFGHIGDMIQLTFTKNGQGGMTCFILELGPNPTEDPRCGN